MAAKEISKVGEPGVIDSDLSCSPIPKSIQFDFDLATHKDLRSRNF